MRHLHHTPSLRFRDHREEKTEKHYTLRRLQRSTINCTQDNSLYEQSSCGSMHNIHKNWIEKISLGVGCVQGPTPSSRTIGSC